MTVLVAIRTGAAAVLASDSKLTTQGWSGNNPDGTPRYLPQTYDYAVKMVRDLPGSSIAAFAGHGNIGAQTVTDYFSRSSIDLRAHPAVQDERIQTIATEMAQARADFASKHGFDSAKIPPTIGILAAPPLGEIAPRVWRLDLAGAESSASEILTSAGVWIEGKNESVLSLLYAHSTGLTEGLRQKLGLDTPSFQAALASQAHLFPVRQINFLSMPLQEAMDFAVFCADVQIQMDRFLPGAKICGGPIDLLTLEMAPTARITSFPGKTLHHPQAP